MTSAAVIMVAVFSILATLPIIDTKTLGVGLAAAVLIDATVVRGVLLPAAMSLLGDRCWYLPRWMSWLPGRRHEVAAGAQSTRLADAWRADRHLPPGPGDSAASHPGRGTGVGGIKFAAGPVFRGQVHGRYP